MAGVAGVLRSWRRRGAVPLLFLSALLLPLLLLPLLLLDRSLVRILPPLLFLCPVRIG